MQTPSCPSIAGCLAVIPVANCGSEKKKKKLNAFLLRSKPCMRVLALFTQAWQNDSIFNLVTFMTAMLCCLNLNSP